MSYRRLGVLYSRSLVCGGDKDAAGGSSGNDDSSNGPQDV
jgi:hypothetical protein